MKADEREAQRAVDELFDGIEEPFIDPEKPEGQRDTERTHSK